MGQKNMIRLIKRTAKSGKGNIMEELIMEAYHKAASKEFFAITTEVERLLKKQYSCQDARRWLSTGEVQIVLKRQGLLVEFGGA